MNTAQIIKTLGLALVLSMVVACQPANKKRSTRITSRGNVNNVLTQTPFNNTGVDKGDGSYGAWGEIVMASNWSQQQFQGQVQAFLSNLVAPDGGMIALGEVSGMSGQNTGIRIYGTALTNGAFRASGGNNLQVVAQGSQLRIGIFDSYVGKQNAEGETITEVPIMIAQGSSEQFNVSGNVTGNQANITFQDKYGIIRLQGTFNTNVFQGSVYFQNNSAVSGAPRSGYLGVFAVQTCGFFRCQ